jgi:hypothetical protein
MIEYVLKYIQLLIQILTLRQLFLLCTVFVSPILYLELEPVTLEFWVLMYMLNSGKQDSEIQQNL